MIRRLAIGSSAFAALATLLLWGALVCTRGWLWHHVTERVQVFWRGGLEVTTDLRLGHDGERRISITVRDDVAWFGFTTPIEQDHVIGDIQWGTCGFYLWRVTHSPVGMCGWGATPEDSESRQATVNRRISYSVGLPPWVLFLAFAAYPTVAFVRGPLRRWRRRRKGLCLKCGYDLTGNVSGVCPECGERL